MWVNRYTIHGWYVFGITGDDSLHIPIGLVLQTHRSFLTDNRYVWDLCIVYRYIYLQLTKNSQMIRHFSTHHTKISFWDGVGWCRYALCWWFRVSHQCPKKQFRCKRRNVLLWCSKHLRHRNVRVSETGNMLNWNTVKCHTVIWLLYVYNLKASNPSQDTSKLTQIFSSNRAHYVFFWGVSQTRWSVSTLSLFIITLWGPIGSMVSSQRSALLRIEVQAILRNCCSQALRPWWNHGLPWCKCWCRSFSNDLLMSKWVDVCWINCDFPSNQIGTGEVLRTEGWWSRSYFSW